MRGGQARRGLLQQSVSSIKQQRRLSFSHNSFSWIRRCCLFCSLATTSIYPSCSAPPLFVQASPSLQQIRNFATRMTEDDKKKKTPTLLEERPDHGQQHQDDMDDPWANVGGIAVNEKTRRGTTNSATSRTATDSNSNFDPIHNKAHLYHALEGLERYPRYLSRWNNDNDMDKLEQALELQLQNIRQQRRDVALHRQEMDDLVEDFLQVSPRAEHYRAVLLSRPHSWQELKDNVFDASFGKAVEQSRRQQKRKRVAPLLPWENKNSNVSQEKEEELVLEASQLEPLMEQEASDVYSIPVLRPAFCQQLQTFLRELSEYRQARYNRNNVAANTNGEGKSSTTTLSLHTRWIDLDHVGLSWLNDVLLAFVLQPVSRHLFQMDVNGSSGGDGNSSEAARLDWRQGYLAAYTASEKANQVTPRQGLVAHTDDSEVTLNLSLNGGQFQGGDLDLYGLRGTHEAGQYQESYAPVAGRALLHPGRYLHSVTELTAGERFALIVWARSWSGIRATQCPCCWLQRRTGHQQEIRGRNKQSSTNDAASACICGASWN